jgi:hypothetical protein
MRVQRSSSKFRQIPISKRIADLAMELGFSFDPDAVRHVICLGTESLSQGERLRDTLEKLEEEKNSLESNFRRVSSRSQQLESKHVGTMFQFGKISRDNRALAMHLCARSPRGERAGQLRDELIERYIMNYRNE